MSQATFTGSREELQEWGRKRLGRVLARIRRDANLKADFAESDVSQSMVRNIEAGHAYLPLAKAAAYARKLSSKSELGGPFVNGSALTEAYMTLRQTGPDAAQSCFHWAALWESGDALAEQYLLDHLGRKPAFAEPDVRRADEFTAALDALNPFQLDLVLGFARRLPSIGSNIVDDAAIQRWEHANTTHIKDILAIVTCLASELHPGFASSMAALMTSDTLTKIQYCVIGNAAEVSAIRDEIVANIDRHLPGLNKRQRNAVTRKLKFIPCDPTVWQSLEEKLGFTESHGWDSLYLYEQHNAGSLLIGVFRRAAPCRSSQPASLRDWKAEPMNEILPARFIALFRKVHEAACERTPAHPRQERVSAGGRK